MMTLLFLSGYYLDRERFMLAYKTEDESAMSWAFIFYGVLDLITFYLGYYLGGL